MAFIVWVLSGKTGGRTYFRSAGAWAELLAWSHKLRPKESFVNFFKAMHVALCFSLLQAEFADKHIG